ncbi:MAG: hypothetical protein KC503_19065 [Myxococcales bacterium]|nr:hypothetical protein [Myxococcales bacterium]
MVITLPALLGLGLLVASCSDDEQQRQRQRSGGGGASAPQVRLDRSYVTAKVRVPLAPLSVEGATPCAPPPEQAPRQRRAQGVAPDASLDTAPASQPSALLPKPREVKREPSTRQRERPWVPERYAPSW